MIEPLLLIILLLNGLYMKKKKKRKIDCILIQNKINTQVKITNGK